MAPNFKMMALTMVMAFASNQMLDSSNPNHAMLVRVVYGLGQLFSYGVLTYMYFKAKNNTEPGVLTVKEDLGFGQEGEREEKITISEHDQRACMKEFQKFGIGTALTVFLHWKWGFFPPLVIQTVTQPYNVFQSSLAKVTLLGERSWGELRRPWRDAAAFGSQWNSWNDTVQSALTGEPVVRPNKKAAKREKAAAKRKSK